MAMHKREQAGRVWFWQIRDERWRGQRRTMRVEGLELVLADTPWAGAPTQSWRCDLGDFVQGAFHEIIEETFGQGALKEALEAARAALPAPRAAKPAQPPGAPRVATRKVVGPSGAQPAPARLSKPKKTKKLTPAAPDAAQVGVALTACPQVDMTTAVTLKALLGIQARELHKKLGHLPSQFTARISREKAQRLQQRLEALGAQVVLTA
jgi:ribosomal protein L7/L12